MSSEVSTAATNESPLLRLPAEILAQICHELWSNVSIGPANWTFISVQFDTWSPQPDPVKLFSLLYTCRKLALMCREYVSRCRITLDYRFTTLFVLEGVQEVYRPYVRRVILPVRFGMALVERFPNLEEIIWINPTIATPTSASTTTASTTTMTTVTTTSTSASASTIAAVTQDDGCDS